jgi:hypothetical protein
MLIRPVTTPSRDGFAAVKVWLPSGNDWYEWSTGTLLKGGQVIERSFSIDEYPIYVKAGAVIPMYDDHIQNLDKTPSNLTIGIFPGTTGKFQLYEDNGNDKNYGSEFATTTIETQKTGIEQVVNIHPAVGKYQAMPARRTFTVKLFGTQPPSKVLVNGKPLQFNSEKREGGWNYDGSNLCLNILLAEQDCRVSQQIRISYDAVQVPEVTAGLVEKFKRLSMITAALKSGDNGNEGMYIPENLGIAEETNRLLDYHPDQFFNYLKQFERSYKLVPEEIRSLKSLDEQTKNKLIRLLQ